MTDEVKIHKFFEIILGDYYFSGYIRINVLFECNFVVVSSMFTILYRLDVSSIYAHQLKVSHRLVRITKKQLIAFLV